MAYNTQQENQERISRINKLYGTEGADYLSGTVNELLGVNSDMFHESSSGSNGQDYSGVLNDDQAMQLMKQIGVYDEVIKSKGDGTAVGDHGAEEWMKKHAKDIVTDFAEYTDSDKNDKDYREALRGAQGDHEATKGVVMQILKQENFHGIGDILKASTSDVTNLKGVDFIKGHDLSSAYGKMVAQQQKMGESYVQGQIHSATQDNYKKRMSILESQRRYGITGAVANAQLQDFDLKANEQLEQIRSDASMKWSQQSGLAAISQKAAMQDSLEFQGILKGISDGKYNNVQGVRAMLPDSYNDEGLSDDTIQNWIDNQGAVSTLSNAMQNTHSEISDKS